MKKTSTLCIASLLVASASAATFDAKGRSIKDNQLSNPGIAKFEKASVQKQVNNSKFNALAKIEPMTNVLSVTPFEGRFSTSNNAYTLKVNGSNKSVPSAADYVREINTLEANDAPRNNANTHAQHYQNSHTSSDHYDYKADNNNCKITSSSYNYNAFFNDVYADILNGLHFNPTYSGSTPTHGCSGTYSNTCANGINIYNVVPDHYPVSFNGNSCKDALSNLDYSYRIQHYNVNQFLATASPNATLYTVSEYGARQNGVYMPAHYFNGKGGFEWHFFSNSGENSNAPHVGNIISSSRKNVTEYTTEAASIDEYIYYTRAIEFAAYTEEGQKTGPGTSLNAISVSPVNSDGYILKRDVVANAKFLANQSLSGISKPDIYSLSFAYNSYDDFSRKVTHDNNETDIFGITDSWGASTTAAAMAADLLSKYPFYKWHPELVKALMITANNRQRNIRINHNNIDDITSSNITQGSTVQTRSVTLFNEMIRNNTSRYWYGNNNNFFSQEKLTFTENVDRGANYNIAIAWLVNGAYAYSQKHISSDFNIVIYDNATGTKLAQALKPSYSLSNTRSLELNVPSNVSKIKVEITRSRNTGDRVILGFNMHKVTQ